MPTAEQLQARIDAAVRKCRDAATALTDAELVVAICDLELNAALAAARAARDLHLFHLQQSEAAQ